jgi:lysophospholipase L1-like esterase
MNPNSNAKRILCFGDSNTWGRSGANPVRYAPNVRWTGVLQQKLGNEFEVIEEGLRSRTTNLDDPDPKFPNRNGIEYFIPCIESHQIIDVVILWLGTNDFKEKYHRSAGDVAVALQEFIDVIKNVCGDKTSILLVSPPLIREEVAEVGWQFTGAGIKSQQLVPLLKDLAQKNMCNFLNLSDKVFAGDFDGVHLEPDQHIKLAEIFYQKVKEICHN